ncbi:hypothetical protein Esti_006022 [Eimeria stiedai]
MEGRRRGLLAGRAPLNSILRCLLCLWCFSEAAAAFQLKGAPSSFWLPPVKQGPLEVFIEPHTWVHQGAARAPWGPQASAFPKGPTTLGLHAPHMQLRPSQLCAHYASDSFASAEEDEEEEDSAVRPRENPMQLQISARGNLSRDFSWGTRKQSYARVRLLEGAGKLTINQRNGEEYLQGNDFWLLNCKAPLMEVKAEHKYDVEAEPAKTPYFISDEAKAVIEQVKKGKCMHSIIQLMVDKDTCVISPKATLPFDGCSRADRVDRVLKLAKKEGPCLFIFRVDLKSNSPEWALLAWAPADTVINLKQQSQSAKRVESAQTHGMASAWIQTGRSFFRCGLTFASGALSTTAGDLHERVFPQFTSSRSHGRRHFPIPSLSGFEVTKPRFSSFNNDSYAKVDAAETRESTSPRVGNLQDEAAVSGESWIDPPPVEYSYPLEDYLVIPNTRRYCEGSTILLATSAKNVISAIIDKLLCHFQSKYKDSVDARVACSSSQNCVFASSSAAKRIGLPLPTTFQDDLLPGTGTTCLSKRGAEPSQREAKSHHGWSGSEWFRGTKAFGWVTLVKGEALRAGCPDFDLHLNTITVSLASMHDSAVGIQR